MRWIDLLRMSSASLRRRKLRTFLTILGVVIGTASIVVMISLGLGLQQSMYQEIEQSGGLTSLTVTGKDSGQGGTYYGYGMAEQQEESVKYLTDDVVESLKQLEHVQDVQPVLQAGVLLKKGGYLAYENLTGMTPEGLRDLKIELDGNGTLPDPKSADLELVFGNGIITDFFEESTNRYYFETGILPDIDLAGDSLFLILDQEAYFSSKEKTMGMESEQTGNQTAAKTKSAKKYVVKGCGVVKGEIDTYNAHTYSIYCDLDKLREMLKKEFHGRAIPGQPSTKSGKSYSKFVYSSLKVKADNLEEVEALSTEIRNMGFNVTTNAEYMESMQKQFAMVQAVLGGIGAVSLFVAAIGIANTMMMSIYERTKEIGVFKVLGCSLKNIRQMFLAEAAFIGFIGGLAGNILSLLLSLAVNFVVSQSGALGITGNISYIPMWLMVLSMAFAVLVGMAAGYFPAVRAMRLSPLAAIRSE